MNEMLPHGPINKSTLQNLESNEKFENLQQRLEESTKFLLMSGEQRREMIKQTKILHTLNQEELKQIALDLELIEEKTTERLNEGNIIDIDMYIDLINAFQTGNKNLLIKYLNLAESLPNSNIESVSSTFHDYPCYEMDSRGWVTEDTYYPEKDPNRAELIQSIIQTELNKVNSENHIESKDTLRKELVLIAGLPGVGKSHFIQPMNMNNSGTSEQKYVTVSPDDIKPNLLPNYDHGNIEDIRRTHDESCFIADLLQKEAVAQGKSIMREITLSHLESTLEMISDAQENGYNIKIMYIHSDLGLRNNFAFRERSVPGLQYVKSALSSLKNLVYLLENNKSNSPVDITVLDNTDFTPQIMYSTENPSHSVEEIYNKYPQIEKLGH